MSKFKLPGLIATALTFLTVGLAQATPVIVVGNYNLLPNTANQTITIPVSGGDLVAGLNFNIQVADGYPDASGSTIDGPDITAVDIIGPGTIFNGNNTGQNDFHYPQVWIESTTTSSGTVSANGTLAKVTFSTIGWSTLGQSWALKLADTFNGDTDFGGTSANITNGSITIAAAIPEPASLALLGCAVPLFLKRRSRKTN